MYTLALVENICFTWILFNSLDWSNNKRTFLFNKSL